MMQAGNGNKESQTLTLNVTVDEANLILEGLGTIPFARVYTLVNKLQEQATQQMNGAVNNGAPAIEKESALSKA